jgi:hypothetical protein
MDEGRSKSGIGVSLSRPILIIFMSALSRLSGLKISTLPARTEPAVLLNFPLMRAVKQGCLKPLPAGLKIVQAEKTTRKEEKK